MTVGRGMVRAGAADGLAAAVAQVRDEDDLVVGAGFLVADDLLVTCAHVLADGRYGPGSTVTLVFPRADGAPEVTGMVLEDPWRDPREEDVALVRLERPVGVAPLQLGSAAGARGHRVRSFGFPQQAPPGGHYGFATAGGILPAADSTGELLQLTAANDLTQGFSGGPVLDETTGLVVGMLTSITPPDNHNRGQEIAYVTPTSVLRQAWSGPDRPDELDVSPYRALEPFTAEHARWFRGREDAVDRVLAGLAGGRRVVLLLGPSGSGKSSLVQAGVLPALAEGRLPGSDRWRQVLTRPGPDLPGALARAGLPGGEAEAPGADATDGVDAASGGADAVGEPRVVLVVDQFEELLAPSAGPEGLQALARITAAIRSDAPLSVVLVMRDDFYSRLSALAPDLLDTAQQASGVLNVPATLSAADLDAIVTGPAHDLDTAFEPGLSEQIIAHVLDLNPRTADTGGAPVTVLPLLEVALTRLWERRLEYDGRLTHDAYQRIGEVTGALTEWCETALRELDQDQRNTARKILTALVRPADPSLNIPAARQQRPLGYLRELAAADDTPDALRAVDEVLAVLSQHRIVTTDRLHDDARPDGPPGTEGTAVAELVHDALIRDWVTLHNWVEEDARLHDWLHRAGQQHTRWEKRRDPQDLPTGTLLAEGTDLAKHHRLPGHLDAFLKAGHQRQQAAARRSRRLNTVLATTLALALIATGIAIWRQQAAVASQQVAQSRQLAAQSASLAASDPELAGLLAVAAYRTSPTKEAAAAIRSGAHPFLRPRFGSKSYWKSYWGMSAVAFIHDGRTLATVETDDGTLRLWDAVTGAAVANPTTGTGTGTGTGQFANPTTGTGPVQSVTFSPDGHTLATAGADGSVWLWDAVTGAAVANPVPGHTGPMLAVMGPNKAPAVPVPDEPYRGNPESVPVGVWDAVVGATFFPGTGGHSGLVQSVTFSPDGRTLAAVDTFSGSVVLWDAVTGEVVANPITGHTEPVQSVAFGPDGRTLATGGADGSVRLWDAVTGAALANPTTGHTGRVLTVAFSPDGRTLATGGADGRAQLWDVATIRTVTTTARVVPEISYSTLRQGTVSPMLFSPDRHILATGGAGHGGSVRLWDTTTGKPSADLKLDRIGDVKAAAFTPDGHTLATVSAEGSVRLWDTTTGKPSADLKLDRIGDVKAAAFTPDGHT
ncbi:trypsin-like peptidase domain-containing protein, partial [Kitasatospora sp. NPDC058063]|uniref:nSTAND1 domain-containing NTPase n=1 Tax=Kitasatospora sp. NPDC058063 TaxID=3346321 RepID=UPI0036D86C77